jgi:hypothetical protein
VGLQKSLENAGVKNGDRRPKIIKRPLLLSLQQRDREGPTIAIGIDVAHIEAVDWYFVKPEAIGRIGQAKHLGPIETPFGRLWKVGSSQERVLKWQCLPRNKPVRIMSEELSSRLWTVMHVHAFVNRQAKRKLSAS